MEALLFLVIRVVEEEGEVTRPPSNSFTLAAGLAAILEDLRV